MNKFFLTYIFFNFLFSDSCLEKIYKNTFSVKNHEILQIDLYGSFSNQENNTLKKIILFINILSYFFKKNKNRTFKIRTKRVQEIMVCKNLNKNIGN